MNTAIRRTVTTLTAAVVLTATPAVAAFAVHRDENGPRVPNHPCKYEDGPGPCFWDAGARGNHRGHSFWITRTGRVIYLDPRVNR